MTSPHGEKERLERQTGRVSRAKRLVVFLLDISQTCRAPESQEKSSAPRFQFSGRWKQDSTKPGTPIPSPPRVIDSSATAARRKPKETGRIPPQISEAAIRKLGKPQGRPSRTAILLVMIDYLLTRDELNQATGCRRAALPSIHVGAISRSWYVEVGPSADVVEEHTHISFKARHNILQVTKNIDLSLPPGVDFEVLHTRPEIPGMCLNRPHTSGPKLRTNTSETCKSQSSLSRHIL